jgi:hypothetical protein
VKRVLLVSMVVLVGCNRGLPEREAELVALRKEEAQLVAQLNLLTRNVATLESATDSEQNRAKAAAVQLKQTQVSAVALWKGEVATLEAKKKGAKLTPSLTAALDLAQTVAGGETVERRFVRAATAKDGAELAKLVDSWELNWLEENNPEPESDEPAPKVCPANRSLSCTAIDDDSLWCPDGQERSSWALLVQNGELTVARLMEGHEHVVDSRLAPRVWLTREGNASDGAIYLHVIRGNRFVTQWQRRLTDDPVDRLEQLKANLDEDPFVEALFWDKNDLLFVDVTTREDTVLWRDARACDALELIEGVPAPVRERCRALKMPKDAGQ